MKTMEITVFDDKTFNEIPEQDNPAFDKEECLMIYLSRSEVGAKFTVAHIVPTLDPYNEEAVTRIGCFWKLETAKFFAEKYMINLIEEF